MIDDPTPKQRDAMRSLYQAFGDDEAGATAAYAEAETAGYVRRASNENNMSPEAYAKALWDDGKAKGWLSDAFKRRIILVWVKHGLEPLTSYRNGTEFQTLKEAASEAIKLTAAKRAAGLSPWIRAGTGVGAYVLNLQGILLLLAAYQEGTGA